MSREIVHSHSYATFFRLPAALLRKVSNSNFALAKAFLLAKCVLTILELNWNRRLRDKTTKLNIRHHILAQVVHTTAKKFISRRGKNENVYEMSKNENCTCKVCKTIAFHRQICKFVTFLLLPSSWLLNGLGSVLTWNYHISDFGGNDNIQLQ